jgi:hypothetical protein
MFANFVITRDWMVSRTAQRVYGAACLGSIAFVPIFVVATVSTLLPDWLVSVALLAACLSISTLTYAMLYFAYRYDSGSSTRRALWIASFLLLPLVPHLIYYWFVYRRSPALSPTEIAVGADVGR